MTVIARPDLSARPLQTTCERVLAASRSRVFAAWTERFDAWFAEPGTVAMVAEPGRPWFFYNRVEWGRHPHYGRFLELVEDELVETTWLTGNGEVVGTEGAETVLRVELLAEGDATRLRLTHSGFAAERARAGHAENWPLALVELERALG
ncbi:MAG: SRPBCC domain-containing protein [Planctomycetes bacterium]|nr:SRPBCC domain-containing protein [Planctomycetota bacterium]